MKKLFILLTMICGIQLAEASETADIKIKINGIGRDNRYFLCLPNVGCLSLLAAAKGRIYPIFRPIQVDNIFVVDVRNNFHLQLQKIPQSCRVNVAANHTLTISGKLAVNANKFQLNQVNCRVS